MKRTELGKNAVVLTLGGSNTTASALWGATYLLTEHTNVMARLKVEVHQAFHSEADIDLVTVTNLPYMRAVTKRSLAHVSSRTQFRTLPCGGVSARQCSPGPVRHRKRKPARDDLLIHRTVAVWHCNALDCHWYTPLSNVQ